tara:strand:+ start:1076 stop:2026 length:951 start_codon:yes stop_codon:yes gene_type:complete
MNKRVRKKYFKAKSIKRNKAIQQALYEKLNPEYDELNSIVDNLYRKISDDDYQHNNNGRANLNNPSDIILYDTKDKPEKLFTFIMALKNRSRRAINSIKSIVNSHSSKYIDFIIVEDQSVDMLEIPDEYKNYIDYNIVNNGEEWSKSPLLNFGIKKAKTLLCVIWDSDFFFPENFIDRLLNFIKDKNIYNQFFYIPSFETHDGFINIYEYKAGDCYGGIWIYPTNILIDVNGFNEKMTDHSPEDTEMEQKIYKYLFINKRFSTYTSDKKLMVFHQSHNNKLRTKKTRSELEEQKRLFLTDIEKNEDDSWGQLIKIN